MSKSSHEFSFTGRPEYTFWERCQQIAKIVDRAQSKEEGSADYIMYKEKAERLLQSIIRTKAKGIRIGLPITYRVVIKELEVLKIKLIKLIYQLP